MSWSLTHDEFIIRCQKRHNSYYAYDKTRYVHSLKRVIVTCPEHGDFEIKAHDHSKGVGCRLCFYKRLTYSTSKFVEKCKAIHGERYLYHDTLYHSAHSSVLIMCRVHGQFEQLAKHHVAGRGCDQCARCRSTTSKVETQWLDALGIDQKYRQRHLVVDGRIHKVDAYVDETNTIYEFYGDYWHGNPVTYRPGDINPSSHKSYGTLYEDTKRREQTLRTSGYNLVTIWESEFWCMDGMGIPTSAMS
jgi:hypothetical protein